MKEIIVSKQLGETAYRTRPGRALQRHLQAFRDDESGVIVAFSVWFMLLILFVGALGVDVMRFESQRTRLQSALDQAVLAAADLDQKSPAASVVADYFDKFNVDAELTSTIVDEGLNYRNVQATARQIVPTQLLHMLNVDEMIAPAASEAEERVEGIEISMVLDVSGSMAGTRIQRLQPAAIEFVDTVLALSDAEDVSISIVPYATQVGAGESLLEEFRTSEGQDYSHCINFDSDDFDTTAMAPLANGSHTYKATQHFDPWYEVEDSYGLTYPNTNTTGTTRKRTGKYTLPVCPNYEHSQILPLTNNTTLLYGRINGLVAGGNTSSDIGVKWGAALLDPSLQPVVTNLIAKGEVQSVFGGLPRAYSDPDSIKVMVVMADGQNTSQYYMRDEFRSGDSNVWYDPEHDRYAVYYNSRYYYQNQSGNYSISTSYREWSLNDINKNGWSNSSNYDPNDDRLDGSLQVNGFFRLSNQELFARASNEWIDDVLYKYIGSYNWDSSPRTYVGSTTKDNRMQDTCDAAKNAGVVIYTIGFEAGSHGEDELEDCASSPSHFFDVEGTEISEAFSAIAQSISQLKLIQ